MSKKIFWISLFLAFKVNAYEFTLDFKSGIYWQEYPITINLYGDNSESFSQLYRIISEAKSDWERAVGKEIWDIRVNENREGPNTIRWSNNFTAETGFDSATTLAVTMRENDGSFFKKVEIILNGQNQSLVQNWNGLLKKTILHELGHTIGLDHSSESAIMGVYIVELDHLTQDDQKGAIEILEENTLRQRLGYSAALLSGKEKNKQMSLACGSIDLEQKGGPSGPISFAAGMIILYLTAWFLRSLRHIPIVPLWKNWN